MPEHLTPEASLAEQGFTIVQIEGVDCVSVVDAARHLELSVSMTHRRINSRRSMLETKEWAGVLGVTVKSLHAEKESEEEKSRPRRKSTKEAVDAQHA